MPAPGDAEPLSLLSAFNPHEFSETTVRNVATGREDDLARILAAIRGNLDSQTIQHLIVSAPRGYGKSFMMRHVQIEVERIARTEELALAVLLLPEEMPHVREPETLIRELTRGVHGGAGGEAELTWHEDDGAGWDTAIESLDAAIRQKVGAHGLLVALVENFDLLLHRAFPKEVQASRLRAYLTGRSGRLMLIAASASGAFDRNYDSRLFQAFKEVVLEPWTVEECLSFFDRQRKDAGKPPLDPLARARAQAVASFIGGTPRLATLLGDALFDEDLLGAADLLQRLVDELTPYYKERIEALPGRAQKLLDALLRGGEPATQSEIARRVKANSQAAIAGPFSDLVKERIVIGEKAPDSAEVLYRVADRVFAHYYRRRIVDHGRAACPLEALVELLAEYFSPEEKQNKAAEFARRGRIQEARVMARLHDADRGVGKAARQSMLENTARLYIPKWLLPLGDSVDVGHLRAIADFLNIGEVDQAYDRIAAAMLSVDRWNGRILLLLARSALDAYEGIEGGLAAADEAIAAVEQVSDPRFRIAAQLMRAWSLRLLDRFAEALDLALQTSEQAQAVGLDLEQARSLRYAAICLGKLGRYKDAIAAAREAASLAQRAGDAGEGVESLRHAAFSLGQIGRHEEAVVVAGQAADLARNAGNESGEISALGSLAWNLGKVARPADAIQALAAAAEILDNLPNGDKMIESLKITANQVGWDESTTLSLAASDVGQLHGLLRQAVKSLDIDGLRRTLLVVWLDAVINQAIGEIREPDRLDDLATAIDLQFVGRFSSETARLRDVARYHRSDRDPAVLARFDPDLARMLQIIAPPPKKASAKRRKRKVN